MFQDIGNSAGGLEKQAHGFHSVVSAAVKLFEINDVAEGAEILPDVVCCHFFTTRPDNLTECHIHQDTMPIQ